MSFSSFPSLFFLALFLSRFMFKLYTILFCLFFCTKWNNNQHLTEYFTLRILVIDTVPRSICIATCVKCKIQVRRKIIISSVKCQLYKKSTSPVSLYQRGVKLVWFPRWMKRVPRWTQLSNAYSWRQKNRKYKGNIYNTNLRWGETLCPHPLETDVQVKQTIVWK